MINPMDSKAVLPQLLADMRDSNFLGIDPSSIKFDKKVVFVNGVISKMPNVFFGGDISAKIISPRHLVFSKGLGLVLSGLAQKKRLSAEDSDVIEEIAVLLEGKKISGKSIWAHDIDYSFPGGKVVTTSTPNLVTSAFVANGFFDLFVAHSSMAHLSKFNSIVEDLMSVIPFKVIAEEEICYMYTPVTGYHVHNANLLFAELLSKYLSVNNIEDDELKAKVQHAVNYTLNHFAQTGTFPYGGPPTANDSIDNYHTGYVLRSLNAIHRYAPEIFDGNVFLTWREKLLNFYVTNFVGHFVVRDKTGLLETHSLAESIIILSEFKSHLSELQISSPENAIGHTKKILWCEIEGYFINNIKCLWGIRLKDKTKMIRWSSSWMFYALSLEVNSEY